MQPILPRWLLVVLAVLLLGFAFVAAASNASAAPVNKEHKQECSFNGMNDQVDWTNREEFRTGWCVVHKWSIPGGFAKLDSVFTCESGSSSWNRWAYNPNGHVGLGQHDEDSWPGRVRTYEPRRWELKPSWKNSRTQVVVTVLMVRHLGWGPWSCT